MVKSCIAIGCRNKHKKELSGLCDYHQEMYDKGTAIIVEVLVDSKGKRICAYE